MVDDKLQKYNFKLPDDLPKLLASSIKVIKDATKRSLADSDVPEAFVTQFTSALTSLTSDEHNRFIARGIARNEWINTDLFTARGILEGCLRSEIMAKALTRFLAARPGRAEALIAKLEENRKYLKEKEIQQTKAQIEMIEAYRKGEFSERFKETLRACLLPDEDFDTVLEALRTAPGFEDGWWKQSTEPVAPGEAVGCDAARSNLTRLRHN